MINKIIKNNKIEEILFCSLFLSVFLIYSKNLLVHFSLPKLAFLRLFTILILILWIYRFIKNNTKPLPNLIIISTLSLLLWWVGTTFYALHLPTAFNGFYGRYNGLWSHINYLLLFLICASLPLNFKRIEVIIKLLVISLIPVALYSLYQLTFLNIELSWSIERPFSTIGHPVTLAALLGLSLPFSLIFFFQANKKNKKLAWGISTLIIFLAIISTLSRGPWVGSFVSIIIVVKTYLKKKESIGRKSLIYLVLIIAFSALVYTGFNTKFRDKLEGRFKANTDSIKHRILYLKSAVDIIKDYPITGIGFECFRIIYPLYRPPEDTYIRHNATPTMVHNGYLQIAVTNGIPALIIYVVLIICVLRLLYRTKHGKEKELKYFLTACISSIIGYLIQDLSGWLEVALTPFFWIVLGFSVSVCVENNKKFDDVSFKHRKPTVFIFSILSLSFLIFQFLVTIQNIYIDHMFWKSKQLLSRNNVDIDQYIEKGLKTNPTDYSYEEIAGVLYFKKYLKDGNRKTYYKSVTLLENAHLHNPYDSFVLINRIQLDALALKRGIISKPSEFTEQVVVTLPTLDKYNPKVYKAIGRLMYEDKKYQRAKTYFDKAKKLIAIQSP